MLLITGATGTIGSQVLPLVAERGVPVRAMTREPARLDAPAGVEVVRGDYGDPASLAAAVAGVATLFLLTAPSAGGPDHDLAMLAAAADAEVRRVVRLSAIATGEVTSDGKIIGADHLRADEALQGSGMAWTILRPTTFASNVLWWQEPVTNLTGDGRQGIVDPRDVAAVAAEVLLDDSYDNRVLTLTGPELLSVPDQVAIVEDVLGRPLEVVDGEPVGLPEQVVTGSRWVRDGHNAIVTTTVPDILGRPATTFATWANDHRSHLAQ